MVCTSRTPSCAIPINVAHLRSCVRSGASRASAKSVQPAAGAAVTISFRAQLIGFPVKLNPTPRYQRIVFEDHQPILGLSLMEDAALGLQRNQRLDVVAHDPWQRKVMRRRTHVSEKKRALSA